MRPIVRGLLRLLRVGSAGVAKVQVDLRRLSPDQQELRGPLGAAPRPMKGYNFSEPVRKMLAGAREEAAGLRHEYIGTEHILLGMLREGNGASIDILENLDVNVLELREGLLGALKPGRDHGPSGPDLPYTSRAKKVLDEAMAEAIELNHSYVGSEHLLLGLLREQKGIAGQVLDASGVTVDNARHELLVILGAEPRKPGFHTSAGSCLTAIPSTGTGPQYAERLRSVIDAAHDIAALRNSTHVTSVHAMIALLEHDEGMANAALDSLSFKRNDALAALHELAPAGTDAIGPEDVLDRSEDLSHVLRALGAPTQGGFVFGTQHLLLLLLRSSPEVAAVFETQNIPYHAVRNAVLRMSG